LPQFGHGTISTAGGEKGEAWGVDAVAGIDVGTFIGFAAGTAVTELGGTACPAIEGRMLEGTWTGSEPKPICTCTEPGDEVTALGGAWTAVAGRFVCWKLMGAAIGTPAAGDVSRTGAEGARGTGAGIDIPGSPGGLMATVPDAGVILPIAGEKGEANGVAAWGVGWGDTTGATGSGTEGATGCATGAGAALLSLEPQPRQNL
jgi:hypothetical protein